MSCIVKSRIMQICSTLIVLTDYSLFLDTVLLFLISIYHVFLTERGGAEKYVARHSVVGLHLFVIIPVSTIFYLLHNCFIVLVFIWRSSSEDQNGQTQHDRYWLNFHVKVNLFSFILMLIHELWEGHVKYSFYFIVFLHIASLCTSLHFSVENNIYTVCIFDSNCHKNDVKIYCVVTEKDMFLCFPFISCIFFLYIGLYFHHITLRIL